MGQQEPTEPHGPQLHSATEKQQLSIEMETQIGSFQQKTHSGSPTTKHRHGSEQEEEDNRDF